MVKTKDTQDIREIGGSLTAAFAATDAARLVSRATPAAQDALATFVTAAETLMRHEQSFNNRDRRAVDILDHLRSPEHFKAMRQFASARRDLEAHNPVMAEAVIQLMQKEGVKAPAAKAQTLRV